MKIQKFNQDLLLNESNFEIKQCNFKHFHQIKDKNKISYQTSVMQAKQSKK